MLILVGVLAFFIGIAAGGLIKCRMTNRPYGGSIVVHKENKKLIYTLIINEDAEELQYQKDIFFKVVPYEDSLDRE
jgi:lipoate-protein ligase A